MGDGSKYSVGNKAVGEKSSLRFCVYNFTSLPLFLSLYLSVILSLCLFLSLFHWCLVSVLIFLYLFLHVFYYLYVDEYMIISANIYKP